ncbi:MAG TPA: NERD domain-containing protein [Gammaproteobacteria bacterium]|nr:NERD domain-containing protein [Gammaproteobacteria bacterium]
MPLALVISIITAAVFTAAVAWALLWLSLRLASLLRFKGAFPEGVQNAAGGIARRELRRLERELAVLTAGVSAAVGAAVLLALYGNTRLTGVWLWLLFGLACTLVVAWIVFLVRQLMRWREARFAARAQAAFAASLARLNLQGLRVFHDVALGDLTLDHVVLGLRGLFVIRVVTRRPARGAETVVRINGRSIEFQDGFALLDTLSLTERAARALADMQVKGLSHRPHVLPVVAVPGWEIAPAQGAAGETFLANEKTAMLLTRVAKPADSLMDADVALLQEHLTKLSMDTLL